MRVRFGEFAKQDLDEARAWYAAISPLLARRFAAEVRAAAQRIGRMPELYAVEAADIRKCVMTKFPYTLRYALRGEVVVIVALSHQHRAPGHWHDRADDS